MRTHITSCLRVLPNHKRNHNDDSGSLRQPQHLELHYELFATERTALDGSGVCESTRELRSLTGDHAPWNLFMFLALHFRLMKRRCSAGGRGWRPSFFPALNSRYKERESVDFILIRFLLHITIHGAQAVCRMNSETIRPEGKH